MYANSGNLSVTLPIVSIFSRGTQTLCSKLLSAPLRGIFDLNFMTRNLLKLRVICAVQKKQTKQKQILLWN